MSELKPCPFCGGGHEMRRYDADQSKQWRHPRHKEGCYLEYMDNWWGMHSTRPSAWNTRTPDTSTKVDVGDILNKSDEQIWAEAVQEFGSPAAALAEAERIRNIIKSVTDKTCPKTRDILCDTSAVELINRWLFRARTADGWGDGETFYKNFVDMFKLEAEQWLEKQGELK